jgi:hypothetical protein
MARSPLGMPEYQPAFVEAKAKLQQADKIVM